MATPEQANQVLRALSPTVSQTEDGDFIVVSRESEFALANRDLDSYLAAKTRMEHPVPPAIHRQGYFEQAVEFQGRTPIAIELSRSRTEISAEDPARGRRIALSPASTMFTLAQLDCDEIPQHLRRLISLAHHRSHRIVVGRPDEPNVRPLSVLLARTFTIKITTGEEDSLARSWRKLQALAEASLFHIAYCHSIGISLSFDWERAYYRLGSRRDSQIQFPLRTYTSELLAYYQLALGSESLVLAYLALYKVLEYFFTSSSTKVLHEKMTERLVQPDFSHTKAKKLDDLARVIRSHDAKADERRLLRTVLEHYFAVAELRDWIAAFDADNTDYLTTEQEVFAEPVRVDTSEDQLFASIAHRVYHIRNALVHHKEGEVARFIPFSGQEAILDRELPLLLFLAEQVIIKTGKDLQ